MLEVRVRASGNEAGVYFHPPRCWKSEKICAVETKSQLFHQNLKKGPDGAEFHLDMNSILIKNSASDLEFVRGNVWFKSKEFMSLHTVYGEVQGKGSFFILGSGQKITIRNANADLFIILRNGHRLEVPVGFQIWVSGINDQKEVLMSLPEIIPVAEHLKLWKSLYVGSTRGFVQEVREIRWTWGQLPERAATLYTSIAKYQEKLAQERASREQKRRIAQERESQRIRDLFYQRTFFR